MKYNELTIFSDLDGTLIPYEANAKVSKRNEDAIRAFMADGGRFAVATGRSPIRAEAIVRQVGVNFPCILFNGGAVFDFVSGEFIVKRFLPEDIWDYLEAMSAAIPGVGIVPNSDEPGYSQDEEIALVDSIIAGKDPFQSKWRSNRASWFKVIVAVPVGLSEEFLSFTRSYNMQGLSIVKVHDRVYEILPESVSKGAALEKMYEAGMLQREKTVAIGDYFNDLEMIRVAGIGVSVKNAPNELKSVSKYVTCSCEDDAVAHLIDALRSNKPAR